MSTSKKSSAKPIILTEEAKDAFRIIVQAACNDDLALVHAIDKVTGEEVAILCAVNWPEEGEQAEFVPLAVVRDDMQDRFIPSLPGEAQHNTTH